MSILYFSFLVILSVTAQAADGTYFGASYVQATYSESGFPNAKPTVLAIRLGKEVEKNVSIEGRIGIGLSSDTIHFIYLGVPMTGELKIDNFVGIYAKLNAPVSDNTAFYGLVGLTNGKITAKASASGYTASGSGSDTDASYGIGMDFKANATTSINIEYGHYFGGSGYEVTGLSVGFTTSF